MSGETAVSPFYFIALLIEFLDIAQYMEATRPQTPRCFQVSIIKPETPLDFCTSIENLPRFYPKPIG